MNTRSLSCTIVGASLLLISSAQAAQAPVYNLADGNLVEKLESLERVVNSRTRNQQRVQEQINSMESEISEIRGRIEEQNFQIEKILQRQRELLLAFDIQSQQLQDVSELSAANSTNSSLTTKSPSQSNSQKTTNTTSGNTAVIQPSASLDASVATQSDNDAVDYKAAVDLILKQRDTAAAIPALEKFVDDYPQSRFKPNAHYWLGQIFYNVQNWQAAKKHFGTLYTQYPTSNKVADATLKLGIIAKSLSDNKNAREYFEKVIANHADTTSAKLAQEQINLL